MFIHRVMLRDTEFLYKPLNTIRPFFFCLSHLCFSFICKFWAFFRHVAVVHSSKENNQNTVNRILVFFVYGYLPILSYSSCGEFIIRFLGLYTYLYSNNILISLMVRFCRINFFIAISRYLILLNFQHKIFCKIAV